MSVGTTRTSQSHRFNVAAFAANEHGSVAIVFGLMLMSLLLFVGCAIDIGRIALARSYLTSAVDATTLYATKKMRTEGMDAAQISPLAHAFLDANLKGAAKLITVTGFDLALTDTGTGITVNVKSELQTTFARVAGINTIQVPQTATAVFNEQNQNVEVALQLDVTGSMNDSINGARKIDSLKLATNKLLDILLPTTGNGGANFRVGIAPFAAGVNAGTYASAVTGGSAPGGCVYERRSTYNDATDAIPAGSDSLKTVSDLGRANAIAPPCPANATVTALSSDRSKLQPTVNALAPGGWTSGHLGTTWAWGLISPNWSPVWPSASKPAAYGDSTTRKIAILMTDGIYNTVGGMNDGTEFGGTFGVQSRARAVALCDAMKAKGIAIYTVGFIAAGDNAAAADTLKACASDDSHFYQAQDGDQLFAAFNDIAQKISALRLSK